MDSAAASLGLSSALAVIMFGLGLSLSVDDFVRVRDHQRSVVTALACQVALLPLACLAIVEAVGLAPTLAVGMLLLAASPGGTAANLFSHLFHGDVALNVTLTAVNSVIAVVTLPLIANWSLGHFGPIAGVGEVGLQFTKVVQVFALVLVPVLLGVLVHHRRPQFATSMDRPVRIGSAALLAAVILGAAVAERANLTGYLRQVGAVAAAFALCSLLVGYLVPRAVGVRPRQAIACAMEIGIHNAALAVTIAVSILGSTELAVPAAVYGVVAFPMAAAFGALVGRRRPVIDPPHADPASGVMAARRPGG